jgi:hypothetical protein
MNDLEKITLERIKELSDEAFMKLSLLNLKDLNFTEHILPICNMLRKIGDSSEAIRKNK